MTQETFGEAYQQGFKRTVRFLRSRGASVHAAEDVAQAAWLKGWERLHQLRDERMIVSWVNAIAVNVHRYTIHHEARYQELPELHSSAGIDLARIDAAKILRLCRPRDRDLFEQQMHGLTADEIAIEQGVSTTAIRIRIMRARRAARASLDVCRLTLSPGETGHRKPMACPAPVCLAEPAQHVRHQQNYEYGSQPDAGPSTGTPAAMAVISATTAQQQHQNNNQ